MPESIAPPAASSTPPPASPSPAPSASPDGPSATESFETQFELDSPAAIPAVAAPAAPTQPPVVKPANQPAKSGQQAAPAKPAAAAPAVPTQEFEEVDGVRVPKFKSDKEFRGWGLNGYKKAKTLETELESLRSKHAELEQTVPRTQTEKTQLATKLADLEKKHNEVLAELNFSNYERSPDYKQKYEKPYQDAISRAYKRVKELTVIEEDRSQSADDNGKFPTKERPAKPEDFDEIYGLNYGAATKLATKKFGPEFAAGIMQHWESIREKAEAAVGALNEWKASGEKRQKEQETQSIQTRERVAGLWTQVNTDIKTKNPDLFGERADDKEWNEALTKGTQMADAYFSDRSTQPIEQRLVFDAHVRNRVAAFPALVSRMRKLEAENAQHVKDIAALRGSAPGAPSTQSPNPPAEESTGALDAFDKVL